MYRQFSRLQTIKFLGTKTPPAYVFNLTGSDAFKAARAKGSPLPGLQYIKGANDDSGVIVLKPSIAYWSEDDRNALANWAGSLANMYSVADAFGVPDSNGLGLIYDSVAPENTEATIISTWNLKANEGVSFRFYPYTSQDKGELHCAFQFGKWRLLFYKDKVLLTRINENWNITKEKDALDNQSSDDPALVAASVAAIGPKAYNPPTDGTADAIYDIYVALETPDQNNSIIGNYYQVAILPEPGVGVHVALGTRGFDDAKGQTFVPLLEGETGDIYGETPLTVYTRSNAMFFQIGTMSFASAALSTPPLSTPYDSGDWYSALGGGNISYNVRSNTPPGTTTGITHEIINDAYFRFLVNLTTTDTAYTPFVYWAQAALQGGAYVGDTQFQVDTDDLLDFLHNSPVEDMQVNNDGDMRRMDVTMTLREAFKIQEKLFAYNGNPQSFMLENQVANLSIGAAYNDLSPMITGGMITVCEAPDAAYAMHTQSRSAFHAWTKMSLTLSDAWAILDNDMIDQELAGDGLYLGDYVKHILIDGGFSAGQINVNDTNGRKLPVSTGGDPPCVMPDQEQSRGDYLRSLFDKYGFDWQLYIDGSGVWQMRQRPTSLATVYGQPAAFKSNPTSKDDRLVILSELDWIHDASDFYNKFRVEGGTVRGEPVCREWVIHESIRGIVNTDHSNNYLGYPKKYPTVRDQGIRTEDEADLVLRSLAMRYGVSPRFRRFETYFTLALHRWDLLTADGVNYAVWRNDGASIADDRIGIQVIQV